MKPWISGCIVVWCAGCSAALDDGSALGPPTPPELPTAPSEPAPTGSRWSGVVVEGECGRKTVEYLLVDEVCGETESPTYLDAFRTPMFRDGARVNDVLFTVDGTHLWALDAASPAETKRLSLTSGYGLPLGAALHGSELLLAAGDEGLVIVGVEDPSNPTRLHDVPLPGPALAVHVEGDRAFVAAGGAGLAVVDLSGATPKLDRLIDVPGFAASVAVAGELGIVAACEAVLLVDLATDEVLSKTWLPSAEVDGVAAPAKGVAVVGDVAFVAAGHWGAVAVDIGDPQAPTVLGNCTVDDELFYASGVRASGDHLFVAGGEWGVLTVGVGDPKSACPHLAAPLSARSAPTTFNACSTEPPWKVVDWQTRWAPPPPPPKVLPPPPPRGRDPIQVLPYEDQIYAFGDARRIAVRAIDIRTADESLVRLGRYEEPALVQAIAAQNDRLLVAGPAGGLFHRDEATLLSPDPVAIEGIDQAIAVAILQDGRWLVGFEDGRLRLEGASDEIALGERLWPGPLVTRGTELLSGDRTSARLIDLSLRQETRLSFGAAAELPVALAVSGDRIFAAAPEWIQTRELGGSTPSELSHHQAFTESEILDPSRWSLGLPRRLLAATRDFTVEVASLAKKARLVVHGDTVRSLSLPPADYVGIAAGTERVHLVSADRNEYKSQLVTVELLPSGPVVTKVRSFTGMASGIALDGDRLYIADADRGVRVYEAVDADPRPIGLFTLEVAP